MCCQAFGFQFLKVKMLLAVSILLLAVSPRTSGKEEETFEVESAVIRCLTNVDSQDDDDFRVVNWKPPPLTSFDVTIRPGPHDPNSALEEEVENDIDLNLTRMTKCKSQAVLTIKIKHNGNVPLYDTGSLIKIDHMLDERSGKSVRLGNPIAIKIQEGPVFAVYPLKYLVTVNAKAREEITKFGESGMSVKCAGDICGPHDDDPVSISTKDGFCCSCEDSVKGRLRGGHDCRNRTKTELFYSTHCFRLSDFWYAAFQLGTPEIFHQVYVEVYKSEETEGGTIEWKVSGESGQVAKIDSHNVTNFQDGENLTISYRKVVSNPTQNMDTLGSVNNILLIPTLYYASTTDSMQHETWSSEEIAKHTETYRHGASAESKSTSKSHFPAQLQNGIDDSVLVVPNTLLGKKCSQIGVTAEVFNAQPSPCHETQGTCLRNQPFDLWEMDQGKPGGARFRVKNFGKVHVPAPFKRIKNKMYFVTEHEGEAAAYIDIQQSADELEVTRPGYNAQLVSALSGSTSSGGKLIVEVANTEYTPAFYSVHLLSCTHNLPLQKSDLRLIDALRMETFKLDLHFALEVHLNTRATCSVGVLNQYSEVIAFRMVHLTPGESCICALNCKCICGQDSTCIPLSEDEIISAGFTDPDEFATYDELDQLVSGQNLILLLVVVALILLLLGLCKGIFGRFCCPRFGKFGLGCWANRARKLNHYYEKEYSKMVVMYDDIGNPVDPNTKLPTVERLSWCQEVGLNTVFFLLLPIFCVGYCCCWCCTQSTPTPVAEDEQPLPSSRTSRVRKQPRVKMATSNPETRKPDFNKSGDQTRFGSAAASYNYLDRGSDQPYNQPSHRTLFSSTGVTPYVSWHQKPEITTSETQPRQFKTPEIQNDNESREEPDSSHDRHHPHHNPDLSAAFSGKWKRGESNSELEPSESSTKHESRSSLPNASSSTSSFTPQSNRNKEPIAHVLDSP